jgi:FtsP/CotA-like multicopper oxidase with cupredoxin domain
MLPDRRHFLEMVGIAAVAGSLPPRIGAVAEERSADVGTEPADYTIRIGTGTLELAPDHIVSTTLYNGQFPGPLIRFKEGQRAVVDIYNDTDVPELVHGGGRHALRACAGIPADQLCPKTRRLPLLSHPCSGAGMNYPGVFVLGDLSDDDRPHGMGIVVEYAGHNGKPRWAKPKPFRWDYTRFGKTDTAAPEPDETIEMLIVKHNAAVNGFNLWTLNGEAFSMATMKPLYKIEEGRRYRLKFRNGSDDIHPLHLHRHSFELVRIGGEATAGVIKDVVMLGGFQEIAFDFVADNPGRTLFHCHQQLHMDFGFMALFDNA